VEINLKAQNRFRLAYVSFLCSIIIPQQTDWIPAGPGNCEDYVGFATTMLNEKESEWLKHSESIYTSIPCVFPSQIVKVMNVQLLQSKEK